MQTTECEKENSELPPTKKRYPMHYLSTKRILMRLVKYIIICLLCLIAGFAFGQTDSIQVNGFIGLRGMWQTGNLNQFNLMPNGKVWLNHPKHYAEIIGNYHFIKVDDFEAKNDLWFYGLYQYNHNKRFFPSAHAIGGYAISYRIDHSIVTGLGGGMNVISNSPNRYFQIHIYGSYLDFKFEEKEVIQSLALGSHLRVNIPFNKWMVFNWELGSYHTFKELDFWGGSNLIQLLFQLGEKCALNISHQTYYNHQTADNIENTNMQTLFGFQYSFNKIKN